MHKSSLSYVHGNIPLPLISELNFLYKTVSLAKKRQS